MLIAIMLSGIILNDVAMRGIMLIAIVLTDIMLGATALNVVIPSVIVLNVVAPYPLLVFFSKTNNRFFKVGPGCDVIKLFFTLYIYTKLERLLLAIINSLA